MKILLINPNTSAEMTQRVLRAAREAVGGAATLDALTAQRGVAVVASRAGYAIAAQSVLETWAGHREPADAIVVACFGDPGVAALRELAGVPVYGLAETTLRSASESSDAVAVVTAGLRWKPMLDELAAAWNIGRAYRGTYAIDATGLAAAGDPQAFRRAMQAAIDAAHADGADTVVLGGAALAGRSAEYVSRARLLDGVAVTLEAVLRRSLAATAAEPLPVESQGLAAALTQALRKG